MSDALDLINGLSEEEIQSRILDYEQEGHIVINKDRRISVPAELQRIAVQYDHNIETVKFDCPRYWDGIDMSEMAIYINYMRNDGIKGSYLVNDVEIDETDNNIMHFTWTVSGHATQVKGELCFIVCIKKLNDAGTELIHWNTEINSDMYVSEGLECNEQITDKFPDVITQMLLALDTVEYLHERVTNLQLTNGQTVYFMSNVSVPGGQTSSGGAEAPIPGETWGYMSGSLYEYSFEIPITAPVKENTDYYPTVTFSESDAIGGNYSPIAKHNKRYNSVTIYAKVPPADGTTIETIRLEEVI